MKPPSDSVFLVWDASGLSLPIAERLAQDAKEVVPAVPVVLVTGFGVELTADERRTHGVEMVLEKPLKIADILDAVARAARKRAERT